MLEVTRRQGVAGAVENIQIRTEDANGGFTPLIDVFDGTEELSCVLWPGDDQAVTTSLPAAWVDAPNGVVAVSFPLDVMTAIEATWYDAMLKLADGSKDLAGFKVVVTPGPGAAPAGKVYHTYKDLTDEMPWIDKLATQLKDQSGFRETAADARDWIDGEILRSAPECGCGTLGYGYGYGYGSAGVAEDATLAAALDADQLIVTTATGRRFVKASVYWTLATILRRAVGVNPDNDFLELSKVYDDKAEKMLASCTAEFGPDVDGVAGPLPIALGRTKLRRA